MNRNLSAFIFGGSGAVGSGILKALAEEPRFERVTVYGRKEQVLPIPVDSASFQKFSQKIINFDKLSELTPEEFRGYQVGFYTLGVSSNAVDEATYRKIEHDYSTTIAKLAQEAGCSHFHWLSGMGVSKNARWLFGKVKYQVETELCAMGFPRVSIYRPAGVLTTGTHGGMGGPPGRHTLFRLVDRWNWITVESDLLGKVIVASTFRNSDQKTEVLDNAEINKLGKALDKAAKLGNQ
jgi:nucleoside-diphosphate-sugar epimerase